MPTIVFASGNCKWYNIGSIFLVQTKRMGGYYKTVLKTEDIFEAMSFYNSMVLEDDKCAKKLVAKHKKINTVLLREGSWFKLKVN